MRVSPLAAMCAVLCACATEHPVHEPIVAYHDDPAPMQPVAAPDALPPAQSRAEMLLQCAEQSLEEFNGSETPSAAPLRKAISCFDAVGMWAKATKVQLVVNEQFPDQGSEDRAVHFKGKAMDAMEHASTARQTLWGQHCLAQRGRSPEATTALRVECARDGGFTTWVVELCGAESERRRLDDQTQSTCRDFDRFLVHLQETLAEG